MSIVLVGNAGVAIGTMIGGAVTTVTSSTHKTAPSAPTSSIHGERRSASRVDKLLEAPIRDGLRATKSARVEGPRRPHDM